MRAEFWKRVPLVSGGGVFYFASVTVGRKRYNTSFAVSGELAGGFSIKCEGGVNEIAFGSLRRRGIELFLAECAKKMEATTPPWEGVRATPIVFDLDKEDSS